MPWDQATPAARSTSRPRRHTRAHRSCLSELAVALEYQHDDRRLDQRCCRPKTQFQRHQSQRLTEQIEGPEKLKEQVGQTPANQRQPPNTRCRTLGPRVRNRSEEQGMADAEEEIAQEDHVRSEEHTSE